MCINVYKIILLVCMCCVGICWISCSGNSDDSEQTEVILSVDKNTLTADGKDIITFTVMHAGIDVTADAIIRSVMDGQTLDGNTFSTSKAGTYAFEASYGKYVSKEYNRIYSGRFRTNCIPRTEKSTSKQLGCVLFCSLDYI